MQLTNKFNLPDTFFDVVKSLVYDPTESDPNRVSVTTLINNPTIKLLTVRNWDKIEEDASEHIWRILGSATHYVLERANSSSRLSEEKLTLVIDGITVVGKLDLYDSKHKEVSDWKITSVFAAKNGSKPEWEKQLNCYAYLLRKCGIEVDRLKVNALLKDWSKNEYKRYGGNYPPIAFKSISIKLWSIEEQEAYIKERVALYKKCLPLKSKDLPVCSDEERWKKEDKFAIYKNKNTTATRVLDSQKDAEEYIENNKVGKDKYRIEKRPGEDFKCLNYCQVAPFCPYFKKHYGKKDVDKSSSN